MTLSTSQDQSQPLAVFRGRQLPEPAYLAGYAALAEAFDVDTSLPPVLSATGKRHKKFEKDGWRYYTPRHRPKPTLAGHLTFALRYEGLNPGFLRVLFQVIDPHAIESIVKASPTGRYARRIWFLYEWLTGETLRLPKAAQGVYVPVLDDELQFAAAKGRTVNRYRVRDNLPGTHVICPLVAKTVPLIQMQVISALEEARRLIAEVASPAELNAMIITGERQAIAALAEWHAAAGLVPAIRIEDDPHDAVQLLAVLFSQSGDGDASEKEKLVAFAQHACAGLDPVLAAASVSFAFAALHRQTDKATLGHLRLIRTILAGGLANETGVTLPIFQAMATERTAYAALLLSASLQPIGAQPMSFDATAHAEFLARILKRAVSDCLPAAIGRVQHSQPLAGGFQP